MALIVNFVLSPLLTVALSRVVPLQPAHAAGLLVLGGAAGAPFLPKLAEVSGGNLAYSVALMVLLMVGTIAFMPLALPLIVPGLEADPWRMAKPLLLLMLLPLAIGFALSRSPWAPRLLDFARRVSNLAFILLVVLLLGLNLKTMAATLGSFAIGTYALYVLGMVGVGLLLGGADAAERTVFALGAGNRNIAAALVVAGASFDDPAVTVMLLIASVTGLIVLLVLAKVMRSKVAAGRFGCGHLSQCSSASTSTIRNTVSPTISNTGLRPTVTSSFNCVFMPMPAIDATRHQRENSLPPCVTALGSTPVLLIATSTAKATANHGSSGGRGPLASCVDMRARTNMTANTITGTSIATRISLTTVAMSPVSWLML